MKCKTCKKRMSPTLAECEFNCDGRIIKVVNIPAEACPECGKTKIYSLAYDNAMRYAAESSKLIVDYAACDKKETEDLLVTQILW